MYQVQIWGTGHRWYDRLSTNDYNKAIALFETHTESEWSSRILKDGNPTHHEYFGLETADSTEGYPLNELSDEVIEPLIAETWTRFEQLNLINA